MFNKLKRQMQQLRIMMSLTKWKKKLSTIEDPQPSTSSAPEVI